MIPHNDTPSRIVINDHITHLETIIPATQSRLVIIFLCVWLCGWTAGEFTTASTLISMAMQGASVNGFLVLWLILWTIAGVLAIQELVWRIFGSEVITIGQGELRVERKNQLLFKPEVYLLKEAQQFRVENNQVIYRGRVSSTIYGVIRFKYSYKTIDIGSELEPEEAQFIFETWKKKKYLPQTALA